MLNRFALLSSLLLLVACGERDPLDVKGATDSAYQDSGAGPGGDGGDGGDDTNEDTADTAGGSSQPGHDRSVRPEDLGWQNPNDQDSLKQQRL